MHFSTYILALVGVASAAVLDTKACDAKGACVSNSLCRFNSAGVHDSTDEPAYTCGKAGIVNHQEAAHTMLNFRGGMKDLTPVSKEEFPKCDIVQPGPNSVLLKEVYKNITVYGFINYDCSLTVPNVEACWRNRAGFNNGMAFICKIHRGGEVCETVSRNILQQNQCPAA